MSRWRRIGTAAATILLFAAAMVIKDQEVPLRFAVISPVGPSGSVGEVVDNGLFKVKVERVDAARSVKRPGGLSSTPVVRTDHIFLIVYARISSEREPLRLSTPTLVSSDGMEYAQSSRLRGLGDLFPVYQPKLWYRLALGFELPANQLEGARLVLDNTGIINVLPAKVEVDLDIDEATAARLRAQPQESYEIKAG